MSIVAHAKKDEFAPGISRNSSLSIMPKVDEEKVYEFGIHEHNSVKAGKHYDLRLGDRKTGKAYSWAIPSAKLPEKGKPVLAVPTFIHDIKYMDFEGIIGSGYGKGIVKLPYRGKAVVHYSSPDKVKFTVNINGKPNTFVLFKPENFQSAYLMMNVTKGQKKEAQEYQPTTPFIFDFYSRVPKWVAGTMGAEFLGSRLMRGAGNLLSQNPEFAAKYPGLIKYLTSRRMGILASGLTGVGLAGLATALPRIKNMFRRSPHGYPSEPMVQMPQINYSPAMMGY